MRVAVLGIRKLTDKICRLFEDMGAYAVGFSPEEKPFYVKKKFLFREDDIEGRDRFYDLFRVVYKQNYSQGFLEKICQEGGSISGFSEEDMKHLLQPTEVFLDVDMIIDTIPLQTSLKRAPLLNGTQPPTNQMITTTALPASSYKKIKTIAFATRSGKNSALLSEFDSKENLTLVLMGKNLSALKEKYSSQKEVQFFENYWPLSLDYLSDRKQAFLSFERPDFWGGESLHTLQIDHLFFEEGLSFEENPAFHRFDIREKEKGYFTLSASEKKSTLKDKMIPIMKEVNRLFTAITVFLFTLLSSCSSKNHFNRNADINTFHIASSSNRYFLPNIPNWANFTGQGQCRRKDNIHFLHYGHLNKSYSLDLQSLTKFQVLFNQKYREKREKIRDKPLSPQWEEKIFFQSKDEISLGIRPFFIPPTENTIPLHLLWIDPAFHDPLYKKFLKKTINSLEFFKGYPTLLSECLNQKDMEEFIQTITEKNARFFFISAGMFSPFNRNFQWGKEFQLFLEPFIEDKKIILYTTDKNLKPHALKTPFQVKVIP